VPYGMLFLVALGCPGLCLIGWLICLPTSGWVVALGVLLYGKIMPSCLMWCFWGDRNDRTFENQERTLEELKSFFFSSLFSWTAVFLGSLVISFNDFLVLFLLLLRRSLVYFFYTMIVPLYVV
jgi:hypothetical protein